jgi:hypothetical protein
MESLNEVDDFLERQGEIVKALAEAKHAEEVHAAARAKRRLASSALLMKALDAKLARVRADKLVADYEASQGRPRKRVMTEHEVMAEFENCGVVELE